MSDMKTVLITGSTSGFGPLEDFPDEKWKAIMSLNLSADFCTSKAAVPVDDGRTAH